MDFRLNVSSSGSIKDDIDCAQLTKIPASILDTITDIEKASDTSDTYMGGTSDLDEIEDASIADDDDEAGAGISILQGGISNINLYTHSEGEEQQVIFDSHHQEYIYELTEGRALTEYMEGCQEAIESAFDFNMDCNDQALSNELECVKDKEGNSEGIPKYAEGFHLNYIFSSFDLNDFPWPKLRLISFPSTASSQNEWRIGGECLSFPISQSRSIMNKDDNVDNLMKVVETLNFAETKTRFLELASSSQDQMGEMPQFSRVNVEAAEVVNSMPLQRQLEHQMDKDQRLGNLEIAVRSALKEKEGMEKLSMENINGDSDIGSETLYEDDSQEIIESSEEFDNTEQDGAIEEDSEPKSDTEIELETDSETEIEKAIAAALAEASSTAKQVLGCLSRLVLGGLGVLANVAAVMGFMPDYSLFQNIKLRASQGQEDTAPVVPKKPNIIHGTGGEFNDQHSLNILYLDMNINNDDNGLPIGNDCENITDVHNFSIGNECGNGIPELNTSYC